ncbi:hypothetical protein BGZ81_007177 [Podila clonocystis]|nr:hypothetical protein BGZ81_007177 [Podila clonocystis]
MDYFIDSLFRKDMSVSTSSASAQPTGSEASVTPSTSEVIRIFSNAIQTNALPPEDRRYVAQLVAQRTGIAQADAEKRVTTIFDKVQEAEATARESADKLRKASSYTALWLSDQIMTSTSTTQKNANHASSTLGATAMLRADHKHVSKLFAEYEKTSAITKKKDLVAQICTALTVHAQIEEEIFYPAVKKALKDHELVPEATIEHATLKNLIAQVKDVEPDGEMFDAKITVLSEYVKHHVKEEQNEMFPKVEASKLDMIKLGAQMAARKDELMRQQ